MEALRVKLQEPEGETITIDLWCEKDDSGVKTVVRHLSFFAEWMDADGDTYPFALRFDGVLDYGAWSEDSAKGSHLLIHGRKLSSAAAFPYKSKNYECEFVPVSFYSEGRWHEF
nr:hypothetical protein [uncultured Sphingomonas sp.]